MTRAVVQRKLLDYLEAAHAMERSDVLLLDSLARSSRDPALTSWLQRHRVETEGHAAALRRRLEQLGRGPSWRKLAQTTISARGKQVLDFVRTDQTGKAVRDGFLLESLEIASYQLLQRLAERAGDDETAALARNIRDEEQAMADAYAAWWQCGVDATVADTADGTAQAAERARVKLGDYLEDVQALQRNVLLMLSSVASTTDNSELRERVLTHRDETREQLDEIEMRLHAAGRTTSIRKHAQSLSFAAVKGPLNKVRTDKAGKNARDLYVVDHIEIASYELLERLAAEAGDEETMLLARTHAGAQRAMVAWVDEHWDEFLDETLIGAGAEAAAVRDPQLRSIERLRENERLLVVFDDTCSLCNRTVRWVPFVDRGHRFRYLGYSEAAMAYPEVAARDLDDGVQVRFPDGSLTVGIDAVRSILVRTPLALFGLALYLPGIHAAGERIYREVAARRPRACPIHA